MGPVALGPVNEGNDGADRADRADGTHGAERARTVDVGNPHLVLLQPDAEQVDIAVLGPQLQAAYPDGINVEWIARETDADGELLQLRVWERGAGATLACGTGSVAAAAAARDWGVVNATGPVRVHNPGGTLEVVLGSGPGDPAVLAGPVRKVADIDIHPGMLS
jgi:diaminopimelate epimerase